MTLLISWLGVDSRGPSSIYIASDSRISWQNGRRWDYSRKVFGFNNSPDILGYCGDVLFPTLVLPQVIDLADRGLLFSQNSTSKEKFEEIKKKIVELFKTYPRENMEESFSIVHASRDNKRFFAHIIGWDKTNGWKGEEAKFSAHSDKLFVLGSGKSEFLNKYQKYWECDNKNTSRAVFHCFCDTLFNIKNDYCGGVPQLIGLYRIENARFYGIIANNKRSFLGMDVDKVQGLNSIEWRNELFERCDGIIGKRLKGAQRQPNPCVS
ncbi:MAG: hypothetical protein KKC39_08415 [Candidatus Omnitrophica bacterium]|nr:hypothetical protein [Candidatus Omnitrophota bacterium]MBU4302871.1 hypothetical protein [Candidatus Omnitrophota bacterium]MBU4468741.1 hypothetical protein [Candidatus Omnitrophota bacterium]MCG2708233.1 hypothetical protein [Candidatus Omnitrophota bacterium]